MAGKIFINYRRDDSDAEALNVAQYLENTFGKSNIFIDIDRLRAGQKFARVLEDKLGQCKVMLAIIGPNWLNALGGAESRMHQAARRVIDVGDEAASWRAVARLMYRRQTSAAVEPQAFLDHRLAQGETPAAA